MKSHASVRHVLDFHDVVIAPGEVSVRPADVSLRCQLTRGIGLALPFVGAPVDGVTESAMAIRLAELGGIGVIHRHMPLGKQVEEVRRVKRRQARVVAAPITISADAALAEALDLITTYGVSALPVVEAPSQKVVGIITRRDVGFVEDAGQPVSTLMTRDVITADAGIDTPSARQLMHRHRIEQLVVLDDQGRCAGLVTAKDITRGETLVHATVDALGRLRVAAAVGTGKEAVDRAVAMSDAGLDVVFVDAAHAHSREVASTISQIRQQRSSDIHVIAGNVATADGARSLIDAGADAIKVGTPVAAGLGMPLLQSLIDVADECGLQGIPVLAQGAICNDADAAKALAAGAHALVLDTMIAGCDEAAAGVLYHEGRLYRGAAVSTSEAFRTQVFDAERYAPASGAVTPLLSGLADALRRSVAGAGARDLTQLRDNAELVQVRA